MPPNPERSGNRVPEPFAVTNLESDDDIKKALQARRARQAAKVPAAPGAEPPRMAEAEPAAEQPLQRPPIAMLCILDDGKLDGEWLRLRADRIVLGRNDGDIRIPHDGLMSARHAELVRQRVSGGYRWSLVDLQSTNGTFVRFGSTLLRHEDEVLIGRGRYRFEAALAPGPAPAGSATQTTQAWAEAPVRSLVASWIELGPAGPVNRVALTLPEYWIGRDVKSCTIARPDDGLLNPRHGRLYRDEKGQWHLENNSSLNGLWLRLTAPMTLARACQFRLGEQRFIFRMT